MTRRRGLFVTFDGPSGVGKTTVAGRLHELLHERGSKTLLLSTPSSSALGSLARHGTHDFKGAELSCLVAADRYHCVRTVIEPALASGVTVICDRFTPSSLVLDRLDGLTRGFVWSLYSGLAQPNLAFVLTGAAERCAERAAVRGGYSRFHVVDTEHSKTEVALYGEATRFLRSAGYPAYEYDIGAKAASAVATDLLSVIVERF